jgi:uncharacterized protein YjeT (DUF2065 family)
MPTTLARLRPTVESGDRTMPVVQYITVALPIALGLVMIGTGGANFAGPSLARQNCALWGYPAGFHRVAGSVGVVIGLLLVIPGTGEPTPTCGPRKSRSMAAVTSSAATWLRTTRPPESAKQC